MSHRKDITLRNEALTANNGRSIDECVAITDYLAARGGGEAYQVVACSPLCDVFYIGTPDRQMSDRERKRTRKRRARQIRAELKTELQAVGLLPVGPIIWLLITSPTVWAFLLRWITGVLRDQEGD